MGKCGGGGGTPPMALGTSTDFFRLIPELETVRVTVPDTFEDTVLVTGQRRRIIASCQGRQHDTFDVRGVGVWICFQQFCHHDTEVFTRSSVEFRLTQPAAWRHRDPVDLAGWIAERHATTVLVVIDMDSNDLLGRQQGTQTIRQNMIDVIRLAQARGMAIFEVFCQGNRTHDSLRNAIEQDAEGEAYPHRRVFRKPGTGGACDANCLELETNTPFTEVIVNYQSAIVMGFDGAICVGRSIYGGWKQAGQIAPVDGLEQHTLRELYEPGILDHNVQVITSWKVCICGNAGGPLVSSYLKYRED